MSDATTERKRRADAQRNIEKILDAAVECLSQNPEASASDIAKAAGLGRVTLYGHFPTRQALVEQAVLRALGQGEAVLAALDLDGDPREALRRLIETSWLLIARSTAVLAAAQAILPPERVQQLHAAPAFRVEQLIRRGQAEGVFRADLPMAWLTAVLHHLIHGAANDVAAGRIAEPDAARFIAATVLPAYTAAER